MKWTVLVDNRTNNPALETEHGLSILLETEQHRILLDTGASNLFIRNAERLGIDLSTVDYVFISHGHSDHAGGLRYFMEVNRTAKVIVSPEAVSGKYFSKRGHLHSITAKWPVTGSDRLLPIHKTCTIADFIHIIARIPQNNPIPRANQNLYVQDADGDFVHDDFLWTACCLRAVPIADSKTSLQPVHTLSAKWWEASTCSMAMKLAKNCFRLLTG